MIKTTVTAARNLAQAVNSAPVGWTISIMPDGTCRTDIGSSTRHSEAVYRFCVQDDTRITIAQAREWLRELSRQRADRRAIRAIRARLQED